MRTEKEMFDLILKVAKEDDRIRAVYMNGSRTNPNAKKDIFQDFDIVYLVTETESFIIDKDWIDVFGERLILQTPYELDKIAGHETHLEQNYAYLMQFMDGNRIDLSIKILDSALEDYRTDKLTITLIDKDDVLPKLPEPTDIDYWVKKPSAGQYYRCYNEFHWVLLYIGKGLWREEILYALDHLNDYVRPQLLDMITWYAGILTNFSLSVGKCGKLLKDILPKDLWDRYLQTYPKADMNSVWEAVFVMCELFDEVALLVGKEFDFEYDSEEAKKCYSYMKHLRQLPKDAKEIL